MALKAGLEHQPFSPGRGGTAAAFLAFDMSNFLNGIDLLVDDG